MEGNRQSLDQESQEVQELSGNVAASLAINDEASTSKNVATSAKDLSTANCQPLFTPTMRKRGFSPEEIEEIITSKTDKVFVHSKYKDSISKKSKEVIRDLQLQETKKGKLYSKRRSTGVAVETKVTTQPTDGKPPQGPQSLAQGEDGDSNIEKWAKKAKENQQKLFEWLKGKGKLNPEEYSFEDGQLSRSISGESKSSKKCTAEQLCDVLDGLACDFVDKTISKDYQKGLSEVCDLCRSISMNRIATASAYPDDILTDEGYREWRKHLWLIASFATLLVSLEFVGTKKTEKKTG